MASLFLGLGMGVVLAICLVPTDTRAAVRLDGGGVDLAGLCLE
jgi:hypothetical protein